MVQSRTNNPQKSSATIELGTLTIDIDITMMDRLVALLWPGPIYKTTGSTHSSFNNMYGSMATGKSAVSRTIIGICLPDLPFIVVLQIFNNKLLTLFVMIPGEDRKLTEVFIFTLLCDASKGFMKALNAFITHCKVPQGSVKIKMKVNFYFNKTLLKVLRAGKFKELFWVWVIS